MSARKPQPKFGLASLPHDDEPDIQSLIPEDMVASWNNPYWGSRVKTLLDTSSQQFMDWFKGRPFAPATHGCFSRGDSITEWVRAYRAASAPPRRVMTCNGREVKRPGIYHNLSDHHFALGV